MTRDDARRRRDVGERAVAVVAIQEVGVGRQPLRAAVDRQPLPGAVRALSRLGRRRQIEREIVGDEQIEVAVAIDVEQRTAGAPPIAGGIEARLRRDVLEASLAEVPVQHVAAEVGDEQIDAPVAVRIAGAHARRPADAVEPRGRRRVDEPSAHVAIQPDPRRLPGRPRRGRAARRARAACRSASRGRPTRPRRDRSSPRRSRWSR